MRFYSFVGLDANLFILVVTARAFTGRDTPGDVDAQGRSIAVAWFEQVGVAVDDRIQVRRVEVGSSSMVLKQYTIAEMIRAAGLYLPVDPNETTRSVELQLERKLLDYQLTLYDHQREFLADHGDLGSDAFEFMLSNPCDVEVEFWDSTPLSEMTNFALARLAYVMGPGLRAHGLRAHRPRANGPGSRAHGWRTSWAQGPWAQGPWAQGPWAKAQGPWRLFHVSGRSVLRRLHVTTGADMLRSYETMSKDGLIAALGGALAVHGRGHGGGRGRGDAGVGRGRAAGAARGRARGRGFG